MALRDEFKVRLGADAAPGSPGLTPEFERRIALQEANSIVWARVA